MQHARISGRTHQQPIFRPLSKRLFVAEHAARSFKPGAEIVLQARGGAHVMLLGGEPFPEPRHVYWNFVSSSRDRIRQAADDWRSGRFPQIAGERETTLLPSPEATHDTASPAAAGLNAAE